MCPRILEAVLNGYVVCHADLQIWRRFPRRFQKAERHAPLFCLMSPIKRRSGAASGLKWWGLRALTRSTGQHGRCSHLASWQPMFYCEICAMFAKGNRQTATRWAIKYVYRH